MVIDGLSHTWPRGGPPPPSEWILGLWPERYVGCKLDPNSTAMQYTAPKCGHVPLSLAIDICTCII